MDIKNLVKKLNLGHNAYLIVIILVGVLFMMIPSNDDNKNKQESNKNETLSINYEDDLEEILSQIRGVGDAKVMLTYSSTFEKNIAYEKNLNENEKKDGDSVINETSSQNNVVLSNGEPFVIKEIYPKIQGVIVVTKGADDILVKQDIINAVTTALNIAPHKVCVVKKE